MIESAFESVKITYVIFNITFVITQNQFTLVITQNQLSAQLYTFNPTQFFIPLILILNN